MPENKHIIYLAYLKLIAAIIVWGGSFIATKIVVQEVSPVTVVWLRFLIGFFLLGVFARTRKELKLENFKDILELLFLGFLGITLHQWLQSRGLVTSEASTTAWLVSTNPVFIAVFGWLLLKEKLNWQTVAGISVATLGVLLVVTKGNVLSLFAGGFGAPGDILIMISAPNWALFTVLSKPILKRYSSLKVTFYILFLGWLLTSIQFISGSYWSEIHLLSSRGWIGIAFLGIFCSAVAYIFYNNGMKILSASQVGVFLYLEPIFSSIIAAIILSESIVSATFIGGGLIMLGVWLVNRKAVAQAI